MMGISPVVTKLDAEHDCMMLTANLAEIIVGNLTNPLTYKCTYLNKGKGQNHAFLSLPPPIFFSLNS